MNQGRRQRSGKWEWECERLGRPGKSCSEEISWHSSLISDQSWATSELAGRDGGGVGGAAREARDDTVRGATSNILSAMLARLSRETVSPEGKPAPCEHGWETIGKIVPGGKSCLVGGQQSPGSCCIRRRRCLVKRSCRHFLSKAAVLLIRTSLSFDNVSTSSWLRMMSQTSVANSLDSVAMT